MSTADVDAPQWDSGKTDSVPVSNGKFCMWLFLTSEVMFFAGLLGSYIMLRIAHPDIFHPDNLPAALNIPLASLNTVILITSSFTMALAVHASHSDNEKGVLIFLGVTLTLAALFCALKSFEYYQKIQHGIYPFTGMFYSCYFAVTGAHLLHMIGGMIPMGLFILGGLAVPGRFTKQGNRSVELLGLYWHFVDIVWILVFPLFYLIR